MRARKVFFAIGTLSAFAVLLPPVVSLAVGQAVGETEIENGDTNGDGERNLSDAVYLLNWLFLGGSPPEPIECEAPLAVGLPTTGVTVCYDASGAEIPCGNPTVPGQDGDYVMGCDGNPEGRFVVGDATVFDRCTGLEWQRVSAGGPGYVWSDALQYGDAYYLAADGTWLIDPQEADAHGGVVSSDWRLPNLREAESIVDFGRADPAVASFFEIEPAGYWTSTTFSGRPAEGWCVNYFSGETRPISKGATLKLIVVRGGDS